LFSPLMIPASFCHLRPKTSSSVFEQQSRGTAPENHQFANLGTPFYAPIRKPKKSAQWL